jgi:hypothetical protein
MAKESLMRKRGVDLLFLISFFVASIPLFAAQPAAADRTIEPVSHVSDVAQPAQWPSVAPIQTRKQIKIAVTGVGCGGASGEPCNNDWGDMGGGDGVGGGTDYGGCKNGYVCSLSGGGCGQATYAHCADRVSSTPGAPCKGC